jgi:hypothetical protein
MSSKPTKPQATKARASVTMPICPHCQQAAGVLKQAGAYHEMEHDGSRIKLFYVKCKACEGSFTLREVWPNTPDPGAKD